MGASVGARTSVGLQVGTFGCAPMRAGVDASGRVLALAGSRKDMQPCKCLQVGAPACTQRAP
eukprot:3021931-Lingulodinium_polyedra.AAC.1